MGSNHSSPPLRGVLKEESFFSQSLGIKKRYLIYHPSNSKQKLPVVYLFRGHEKEWINPTQDQSRTQTACEVMDEQIALGRIGEMILVMPSTSSEDGTVLASGVNLRSPSLLQDKTGVGTGAFGDYLLELIAHIDQNYSTRATREGRALDGFSVGGHTALLLGLKHPHLFCSVAAYDGSFGFWRKQDPRQGGRSESDIIFDLHPHIYGKPFDKKHYHRNNPADLVLAARGESLRAMRKIQFYICCAGAPEPHANRDRTLHIISLLSLRGIQNERTYAILDSEAEHTWLWADKYLQQSLIAHDRVFYPLRNKDEAAA